MNEDMTEIVAYTEWLNAVNKLWQHGWKHHWAWIFRAPSGSLHDLSAADLNQIDRIEREKLFLAKENPWED